MAKISLLKKEQKEHLKGEVSQVKRGTAPGMTRYRGFQDRAFIYSLRWVWTENLVDSCKLNNNRLCKEYLSHNSVYYNQMCVSLKCL